VEYVLNQESNVQECDARNDQ